MPVFNPDLSILASIYRPIDYFGMRVAAQELATEQSVAEAKVAESLSNMKANAEKLAIDRSTAAVQVEEARLRMEITKQEKAKNDVLYSAENLQRIVDADNAKRDKERVESELFITKTKAQAAYAKASSGKGISTAALTGDIDAALKINGEVLASLSPELRAAIEEDSISGILSRSGEAVDMLQKKEVLKQYRKQEEFKKALQDFQNSEAQKRKQRDALQLKGEVFTDLSDDVLRDPATTVSKIRENLSTYRTSIETRRGTISDNAKKAELNGVIHQIDDTLSLLESQSVVSDAIGWLAEPVRKNVKAAIDNQLMTLGLRSIPEIGPEGPTVLGMPVHSNIGERGYWIGSAQKASALLFAINRGTEGMPKVARRIISDELIVYKAIAEGKIPDEMIKDALLNRSNWQEEEKLNRLAIETYGSPTDVAASILSPASSGAETFKTDQEAASYAESTGRPARGPGGIFTKGEPTASLPSGNQ